MVPTSTVFGHGTSIESQPSAEHAIFRNLQLLPEDVKTPAVVAGQVPVPPKPMPVAVPSAAAAKPAAPPPPAA